MNDSAAEILSLCDGKRKISEIVKVLSDKYSESIPKIRTDVEELLETCFNLGYIQLHKEPINLEQRIIGDRQLVIPIMAAFEITKNVLCDAGIAIITIDHELLAMSLKGVVCMTTLKEYIGVQMQDAEFREEWERLQPERELMRVLVDARQEKTEYEYDLLKQVEDYRAGRLKTYSLEEVGEMLGLDD